MSIATGFALDGYRSLREVCAPLADELARCFWVIDLYSGPLKILWLLESAENEALADRLAWDVPAFRGGSTRGFRPGTLPRLADQFVFDEQSYYFAIDAPEDEALRRATALNGHIGEFSETFLRDLDRSAELLIVHVDGWWEFYCGRADWVRRLRAAWPEVEERPLARAFTPPTRAC